jgi:hypothetical protein
VLSGEATIEEDGDGFVLRVVALDGGPAAAALARK